MRRPWTRFLARKRRWMSDVIPRPWPPSVCHSPILHRLPPLPSPICLYSHSSDPPPNYPKPYINKIHLHFFRYIYNFWEPPFRSPPLIAIGGGWYRQMFHLIYPDLCSLCCIDYDIMTFATCWMVNVFSKLTKSFGESFTIQEPSVPF